MRHCAAKEDAIDDNNIINGNKILDKVRGTGGLELLRELVERALQVFLETELTDRSW